MKARSTFMPLTIILVALAVLAVLGLGGRWPFNARSRPQQSSPRTGSLRWYAAQAKQQGKTHITLLVQPHYIGVSDLNTVTSNYSSFVGELLATSTVWDETSDYISTWYKFRTTERLTQRTYYSCSECSPATPPSELLPLQQGEFLVPLPGGSVFIDDVIVESALPDFTDIIVGQKYLLFLNFDEANKVGYLSMGPRGALLVTSQGTFAPVVSVPEGETEVISSGLATQYNNSLSQLRAVLNPPPPSTCDPDGSQQQYCTSHGGFWHAEDCSCEYDPCIRKPWLCD
jgi:hypothetical protein